MTLTHFDIQKSKPEDKPYKLADSGGLFLQVQPSGNKHWKMRFVFLGRERVLSFGAYPLVSIAEARTKRDEAKKQILEGTDPSVKKKLDRIAAVSASRNTFRLVAEEYIENLIANNCAPTTIKKNRWFLQNCASPIADRPVAEITAAELLHLLKRIEKSGRRETARRLRGAMSSVFRYAIVTLRATANPCYALKGALLKPNTKPRAAITDEKKFGGLLRSIDGFDGWPTLRAAMLFTALTCARPGEVRGAKRCEFDFAKAIWRIPPERTKTRRAHDVPLSRQALAVLADIWTLSDYGELVFPSIRSNRKMLSENAMNSALRRMGYLQEEMTSHGFRSSASTIMNEQGVNPDVIEAILAHQHGNAVRRAYNRASYWKERVVLMQKWADMLDWFRKIDVPQLLPPLPKVAYQVAYSHGDYVSPIWGR